jgi:hypothetical protein
MLGDLSISNTFAGDGEEVYLTSLKRDLVGHVARVRLVHWICEHANQGLRLDDGVFYTIDDAAVFRFPRGSILVLTSCSTGADTPLGRSIAGGICASSDCTVIAPSSIVAAEASIQFVRAINATINQMPGSHSISHVWRKLRGLDIPSSETSSAPSAEMFFSLWYGMYGDAMTVIRS